jgi:hypothetical protein
MMTEARLRQIGKELAALEAEASSPPTLLGIARELAAEVERLRLFIRHTGANADVFRPDGLRNGCDDVLGEPREDRRRK